MAIHRGWVETFQHDQLVVALSALGAVTNALAGLDIRPGRIRKSAALGLALVSKLADAEVEAAVDRLARDPAIGQELNRFRGEREQAHPGTLATLDLLIKGIRLQLAQRFPGWEVTIGKNYGPSLVKGHPHVGGGGDGDPRRPTAQGVLPPHVGGGGEEEPQPADAGLGEPVSGPDRLRRRGRGVRVGLLDTRIFPNKGLTGHYIAGPMTSSTRICAGSPCSMGTAHLLLPAFCSGHRRPSFTSATCLTVRELAGPGTLP